jgi:hypothetical protein
MKIKFCIKPILYLFVFSLTLGINFIFLKEKVGQAQLESFISAGGVSQTFGGKIFQTIDCSTPASCAPTNKAFPICLAAYCIGQTPFILQVFENYLAMPGGKNGYDQLLDTVLEPVEMGDCPGMCPSLGIFSVEGCSIYCAALPGLQDNNASPAGGLIQGLKNASPVESPGIAMIIHPTPSLIPACNADNPYPLTKFIIGEGLGTGLYFTDITNNMGRGNEVGDNCRGHYYSMGSIY